MNPDNPSFRTPEESRRSQEYIEIKKQLTKATEQIDLLNEEALSRIGVITHLETKLERATELIGKLEDALKWYGQKNEGLYSDARLYLRAQAELEEIAKWRGE